MSGDGHLLRGTEFGRLSRTLAQGAHTLNDLAPDAPWIPDAGQSTTAVAAMVATITSMVSTIVETAAVASDQATASDDTYQQNDQDNAGELSRPGRG
ncbi:MAG: hypothetical protein ACRDRS_26860 [Pseudonocardiaceae bacterium]